jgi:hypothetical protein
LLSHLYTLRGDLYLRQEESAKGIADLETASKLDPDNSETEILLLHAYRAEEHKLRTPPPWSEDRQRQIQQLGDKIEALEGVLGTHRKSASVWLHLNGSNIDLDRVDKARKSSEGPLSLADLADVYFSSGAACGFGCPTRFATHRIAVSAEEPAAGVAVHLHFEVGAEREHVFRYVHFANHGRLNLSPHDRGSWSWVDTSHDEAVFAPETAQITWSVSAPSTLRLISTQVVPNALDLQAVSKATALWSQDYPGDTWIGRFGWKDQHASPLSFAADAYLNEMRTTLNYGYDANGNLLGSAAQSKSSSNAFLYDSNGKLVDSGILGATDPSVRLLQAIKVSQRNAAAIGSQSLIKKKEVFAVGVNGDGARFERLKHAAEDAQRVSVALHGLDFRSTALVNTAATRQKILTELSRVVQASRTGDLFVFYFSGHGFTDINGRPVLVTGETTGGAIETLSLEEINNVLSFHRGRAIVLLDNCLNQAQWDSGAHERPVAGPNRPIFILAGSPGSRVIESSRLGSGLFTSTLLQFLGQQELRSNPEFDLDAMFRFTAAETSRLARDLYGVDQRPQLLLLQ